MTSTPITIVGNLTDEPELRFTASGAAVVKFSVANNRQRFNRDTSTWEDAGTDFHRVTAWNYLAQNVAETLRKGSRVLVFGELKQSHWTDDKTNEKRSGWDVAASAVGPELTFATATVTKTTTGARGQSAPDDPWATASKERPAGEPKGAWPQGTGARGPQAGHSDEPPF
jgi:single-strand DNA-binding protein